MKPVFEKLFTLSDSEFEALLRSYELRWTDDSEIVDSKGNLVTDEMLEVILSNDNDAGNNTANEVDKNE